MSEIVPQLNKITFDQFLKAGVGISLVKQEKRIVGKYIANEEFAYTYFSEAEIDKVHPSLSTVIDIMFSQLHSATDTINVHWLTDTLTYWKNPLELSDLQGKKIAFSEIIVLGDYSETKSAIELKGYVFNTHEKEGLTFVAGRRMQDIFVHKDEMDKHFPGWKVRYDLLSAVNTDPGELIISVLRKDMDQIATQTLPEISFE